MYGTSILDLQLGLEFTQSITKSIIFTIFPVLLIRSYNHYDHNYTLDLDQSWKGKLKIHLRPKVHHLMHTAYNPQLSSKIIPQISLFSSSTNLRNNVYQAQLVICLLNLCFCFVLLCKDSKWFQPGQFVWNF